MQQRQRWMFILCISAVISLLTFLRTSGGTKQIESDSINGEMEECYSTLRRFRPDIRMIIIDKAVLRGFHRSCHYQIEEPFKVAIDDRDSANITASQWPMMNIIFYTDDETKDYLTFHDEDLVRMVLRFEYYSVGNIFFPANIPKFLRFWKQSERRECKNIDMHRGTDSTSYIPETFVRNLADFRNLIHSFDMYPFLNGGSLLGWYRECLFIPHTYDTDMAVFASEYKKPFINHLKTLRGQFRLKRILGKPSDTFELTVLSRSISMDLFFMYHEGNNSWVGGMAGRYKYKYTYPRFKEMCSADLKGHLFHVPCNVEEIIKIEYGENWDKDVETDNFVWFKSHNNVKPNGFWKKNEVKEVEQIFVTERW